MQLQHQIRHAMKTGVVERGDQLPSAREVVAQLGINPNTVLKAYRELERDGLIEFRRGQGTFAAADLMTVPAADLARLRRDLSKWINMASGLGLERDDMLELFAAETGATQRGEATA